MPDQQASTTTVQNDCKKKKKGQHFRPNKSPAASSQNFHQTLTRLKITELSYSKNLTLPRHSKLISKY